MKQFIFICFLILLANPAHAAEDATSTASSTTGGFFSNIIENVTEFGEGVQQQIQGDGRKTVLDQRVQERITNLAANISNRFDGIIARLQNIIGRLEKRLEKQAESGYDVTAARESLESAQSSLDQAKVEMRDIDKSVLDALGSTDPRGEWKKVRAKYITARESIRHAHSELRNTITNLQGATIKPAEPISTSTETIN